MDSPSQENLATRLIHQGLLSSDQVNVALIEKDRKGVSFESALLSLGFITENALAEATALESGYDRIDLQHTLLDPSLKSLISREVAEQYGILPLSYEDGVLRIASSDIYNLKAFDFLSQHGKVIPLIAPASDITDAITDYYGHDLSIPALLQEIETNPAAALNNPTIRLVNAILVDAIKRRASDIHFEPEGAFMRLRYRIDGLLMQVCTLHSSYWPAMCVRIKILGEMNIAESRRPQNGRLTYSLGPRDVDLRLAIHPTIHGENIVIRILDKGRSLLPLDQLGYTPDVMKQINIACTRPEGIIIITGPTGCGKTTSLYSLLSSLNTDSVNIMTLESPVEYKLPRIRQSDIRELGGMDFADGVRSILRQDPDIILIGEIRDATTAQMALRAAMTGHRVFATLHTADAVGVVHRLKDLGISPSLLAGNLAAVVAQRLLRRMCPHCQRGCPSCRGTGSAGRFAIAEVIVFDDKLNDLLLAGASASEIKTHAKGFVPLAKAAKRCVQDGLTTLEEAQRVVGII